MIEVSGTITAAGAVGATTAVRLRTPQGPATKVTVTGTFTATLIAEGIAAGVAHTIGVINAIDLAVAATITVVGHYYIPNAGWDEVRIRCTAFTSAPTVYMGRSEVCPPCIG